MDRPVFQRLAEIAVDAVTPSRQGFTLTGQGAGAGAGAGADHTEYRLELQFDHPLDPRTRAVLGELLSQSEVTVLRRAPAALPRPLRSQRARNS